MNTHPTATHYTANDILDGTVFYSGTSMGEVTTAAYNAVINIARDYGTKTGDGLDVIAHLDDGTSRVIDSVTAGHPVVVAMLRSA